MKTNTTIYTRMPSANEIKRDEERLARLAREAQDDEIVAKACPDRPGTERRIHRLWNGPQGAAYRVNWHDDDRWMGLGGERRIVRSSFVTVKDGLAVVVS